ncbi:MAG TPA: DNA-processing protein DprA [Stellaceae bacterium]|nr:DNA-processing protein DprA [Stellaceae bacterium]
MSAAPRVLNPAEKLDWLRLIRSENVGPVTFYQLLARFGSAAAALDALPDIARRGGRDRPITVFTRGAAERELQSLDRLGARLVAWGEPDYPSALAAVEDAPPLLSVLGQAALLKRPAIAVVGARNASTNGRRFARDLALQLGQKGLIVVSGFARGIDTAAHEGALPTGTVAVLAGGIDILYPEENRALRDAIIERGALLAEMPVGTVPKGRHFPRRNRIISGCSLGVVVVEGALRSGSLITARFALEQGREVFAVPGSPLDPRCRGTNDLIRRGATLTETAEDVTAQLQGPLSPRAPARRSAWSDAPPEGPAGGSELETARRRVLERLSPTPVGIDDLVRECQLPQSLTMSVLLELELAGRLERQPGNLVALL